MIRETITFSFDTPDQQERFHQVLEHGGFYKNGRYAATAQPSKRIAELEAALRDAVRHAEKNGMQDWPVFKKMRKVLGTGPT